MAGHRDREKRAVIAPPYCRVNQHLILASMQPRGPEAEFRTKPDFAEHPSTQGYFYGCHIISFRPMQFQALRTRGIASLPGHIGAESKHIHLRMLFRNLPQQAYAFRHKPDIVISDYYKLGVAVSKRIIAVDRKPPPRTAHHNHILPCLKVLRHRDTPVILPRHHIPHAIHRLGKHPRNADYALRSVSGNGYVGSYHLQIFFLYNANLIKRLKIPLFYALCAHTFAPSLRYK